MDALAVNGGESQLIDVNENKSNSRCGSGECVVLEAQCDGQRQCGDGSDEAAEQVLDPLLY